LLHNVFYLLINAPTCFGLSCWPSSGNSVYKIISVFMMITWNSWRYVASKMHFRKC